MDMKGEWNGCRKQDSEDVTVLPVGDGALYSDWKYFGRLRFGEHNIKSYVLAVLSPEMLFRHPSGEVNYWLNFRSEAVGYLV